MKDFFVGDRVVSKLYNLEGIVEDRLYSRKKSEAVYLVHFDGEIPFSAPHYEHDLDVVAFDKKYRWEVFQADNNVVTAVMYEEVNGVEREVDRKHGHVIHDGAIGFAQAASYAMKKIYIGMNEGKLIETEGRGYVSHF